MAIKKSKADQLSNNNYFIVLLLISLLVVGGSVLVGKAMVGGIVRDTKVLTAKNIANAQLEKDVDAAPKLIDHYQALGNKAVIADALPNTSDLPGFMALMENISSSSGVTFKSITPSQSGNTVAMGAVAGSAGVGGAAGVSKGGSESGKGVKPPQSQPYAVSLTFDTNYAALGRLFKGIEQSARPIRVTALQISGSGATLGVQMEVTTYYQDKASLPFSTETLK